MLPDLPAPAPAPGEGSLARVGEYVDRTTVEEVCQLLGYDAADVTALTITPHAVTVYTRPREQRTVIVTNRHVVR